MKKERLKEMAINYEKLKGNLWKIADFKENEETITRACENNDAKFILWFQEELKNEPDHIVIDYFKSKYFPEEYGRINQWIIKSLKSFINSVEYIGFHDIPKEWKEDYSKNPYNLFLFFNSVAKALKENKFDINNPFIENRINILSAFYDIKKTYSDIAIKLIEEGKISFEDIQIELYKDFYGLDSKDVAAAYQHLKKNYPSIKFQIDNRERYVVKYYIDKYTLEEGIEKLIQNSREDSLYSLRHIPTFYIQIYKDSTGLFSKREKKRIFDKCYLDALESGSITISLTDEIKNVYYMLADMGYEEKGVCIDGIKKEPYPVAQIISADKYYDNLVEEVKKYNFSPLEAYIWTYLVCKNYKEYNFFNNSRAEDENYPSYSRDPYLTIDNKWMVCAGYVNMAVIILKRLGIDAEYIPVGSNGGFYHARLGVFINDEKYDIKSSYVGDPTFDAKDGLEQYKSYHMFMEPKMVSDDGYEMSDYEYEKLATVPYQELSLEIFEQALGNVVNKFMNHLSEKRREEIVDSLIKNSGIEVGKREYQEFLKKGKFSSKEAMEEVVKYKAKDLPLKVIGVEIACNENSEIKGFCLGISSTDQSYLDSLKEIEGYKSLPDCPVSTRVYDNNKEGFNELLGDLTLKYVLTREEGQVVDSRKKSL